VLDLTDERGQMAGMMLAQLGAEVIAVEPPGGARSRRLEPSPALHLAYNRGKRSVVLDLGAEEGRARFLDLVATADVLLESADHGTWDRLGLGLDTLEAVNPRLVTVSISAFGRSGPKATWAASDLIAEAAACELFLTGDADRAPVRVSVPQAFLNAAADAACGALTALWERERSGRGQHVDISAQEAAAMMTQGQVLAAAYRAHPIARNGAGLKVGPLRIAWVYPALDGWVTITLLFGPIAAYTVRLLEWMVEEGFVDADVARADWVNFLSNVLAGRVDPSELDRLQERIAAFTSSHTKAELLAREQLAARGYWEVVDGVRYPGPFALAGGGGPALPPLGPAPALGQDTDAILATVPERPRTPAAAGGSGPGDALPAPLAGVKVVDLTWFMAGPATTRMLADWGATVVRVESTTHPDGGRGSGPFPNGRSDPDAGGYGLTHNSGKLGLALDLSRPDARPVLEDLLRWADVAVVNYSPRATRNLGLDWPAVSAVNPQIILVSTCLMGQTGPLAEFAGFGNLSAAVAGFYELGGWPDRPPVGPYLAYTDVVAPRFTFCSILAALDERRRSGRGRYLDISQAEAAMWLLAPAVVDHQLTGRFPDRVGNDDPNFAPHGVYATAGDDRWVAVACTADAQWPALAAAIGRPDLAADPSLATAAGRRARRRELDAVVEAWTSAREGADVEAALQATGVPAHRVLDAAGCWDDPQFAHRGHFQPLPHPRLGEVLVQGPRLHFSRTRCCTERAAPPIGEDTFSVLSDLLGYDADRIADLAAAEVLE
jgi:crotonobetainyl-CoA:carnitine CoA-transferase CaiB-like acyl-CoA transferase